MKQIAVGRKNCLFIGGVEEGNRDAILQTIVRTALRNDLDVWAYVEDILDQLAAGSADIWKESRPGAHPHLSQHYESLVSQRRLH